MTRKDLLKLAKDRVDGLLKTQKEAEQENSNDLEATKLALILESNQSIVEAVEKGYLDINLLSDAVRSAVESIKVEVPQIEIPQVQVHIPEIKLPQIVVPEMKMPEIVIPPIVVPQPKVTVNIPEQKAPIVNIEAPIVNFPDRMDVGLSEFTLKHPMPVMQVDPKGNYVSPIAGGGSGPRRVKIDNNASEPIPITGNISASFSADFGSGEIGSQTLRTVQATDAIASVYITGANSTIGVVTINPDGNPVYGGSSGGGLTDAELRASSVPIAQVSGANWSVSVIDIFGSTASNLINPDNRLKVELPSGASSLTDTELRASHLDVQQVSGAIDSVNVVSTVGLTDTQIRAVSLPVEQVSGSIWSTNVVTMPSVTVTSVTNSIAVSILNGGGTTLDPRDRNWTITETVPISSANTLDVKQVSGAVWSIFVESGNTLDVKQVSGAIDSINVLTMPAVVVTSITNSTASSLVDSTGVQYSGSNPIPTKELRSSTGTNSSVADNAASVTILASNTARLGATVYNDSSATLFLLLGSTPASTTNYTCKVSSSGYYEVPFGYTGQLTGIWATDPGDGAARVTEIT